MKVWALAYCVTLVSMVAIDSVWLTAMSNVLYRPILGDMLLQQFRIVPAIAFYLIYPVGLVAFAVRPAVESGRPTTAIHLGALFGFVAYATYDLTNQATLRNWSSLLTCADMAWGAVLSAAASCIGAVVTRALRS